MRTAEEVLARMTQMQLIDVTGWAQSILVMYGLSFDEAEQFRSDEATHESWPDPSLKRVREAGNEYLAYAMGIPPKHDWVLAGRSVIKLIEFAWLIGADNIVKRIDALDASSQGYYPFGSPVLKLFADNFPGGKTTWRSNSNVIISRMAKGRACSDGCVPCTKERDEL